MTQEDTDMKHFSTAGMLALALGLIAGIASADQPKAASDLLETARKEAAAKRKAIFVMFDASW